MSALTTGKPAKPTKAKRGGQTRKQRSAALRSKADYGTVRLVPRGVPITCRKADGFVNLSEVFTAEAQQRGGSPRRLAAWLRLSTTPAFLDAVLEFDPAVRNLTGESPLDVLLDRGDGRDTWAHHQVACEVAGWLSPPLRVAINQLWMDTVNNRRPRRSPPLDPAIAARRKAAQRPLTDVLAEKGMDGEGIRRCQRQLVFELTGKTPGAWKKELGPDWMEAMPDTFHVGLAMLRGMAAAQCADLDLEGVEGYFRHFNEAFRRAAAPIREIMPVMDDLAPILRARINTSGQLSMGVER